MIQCWKIGVCQTCGRAFERPGDRRHVAPSGQWCSGTMIDAREVIPAERLQGAVILTDEERKRVVWWLSRPVPPGSAKELDVRIMRKIAAP